jgi:hypothetical protein
MSEATKTFDSVEAARRRGQRELNERVGVRLTARSRMSILKWSTWRQRFGRLA